MAVEAVESELAHIPVEAGLQESNSLLHANENGEINQGVDLNEPIKFGSHGTEETIKGETVNVREGNLRKDAVDEWPEPKQIHSFYFMKYRSFDDQKLKAKLDQADKELQKLNQARFQITEKLRAKRAERAQVISQVRTLSVETRQFRTIMDEKRKEMEPLQQALGKLRNSNASGRDRGYGICSSEEELNDIIKSLNYRMAHESIPLSEEKQILREIKQLEGTRDKVIANAAVRAKIQDSLGEKEVIQDQVKLIGGDLDGVRKEQQVVKAKLKLLDDEKEAIEKQINSLQEELAVVAEKKDKAFEKIQELRKLRDEGNACFYQNRTLLIKARELASKKEIDALKELADTEVDKFVALWTSMKAVRDDYERRILPSLDARQLSRDGRMRNPGEKPLVVTPELSPPPSQPEIIAKPNAKLAKEEPIISSVEKVAKEKNSKNQKEVKDKVTAGADSNLKESKVEVVEEVIAVVEKDTPVPAKKSEADVAKLREMKRDEEIAKAKQAVERKKKLAEKAAAKAAIKAQKEAEKKLKDREKKAKKKAAASGSAVEPEESKEEVGDAEIAEEKVEAPPVKNKERKESSIRSRTRSRGGPDSLPKAILKRKKSTNYWVYAAPSAALLVLLLLALGYYYFI